MKKLLFLLFCVISIFAEAQDSTGNPNRGTIKVEKRALLHSVLYDDVNFRLVCRDVYGNIIDTAVVSFDINFTVKGIAYGEKTTGYTLSKPMQQRLSQLDGMVILMFSNVKAKEKNGTITTFPNFKAQTGSARERVDY